MMMNRPVRKHLSPENLTLMGVPRKFHNLTIQDFDTSRSSGLGKVRDYVESYVGSIDENFENNTGIYFCGSNGVGKTMLACFIVKEAYRHRYTAQRVTFSEYVKKYTAMWGAKSPDEKEQLEELFFQRYKAVEFLVLEEIGKELDTKAVRPILEDLLRYREDEGFVTIICTNLAPKQLREIYGESIYSLIRGNMYLVKIESDDVRKERK